jgi:hypothetical protein
VLSREPEEIMLDNIGDLAIVECEGRIVQSEAAFRLRDAVTSQGDARTSSELCAKCGVNLCDLHSESCENCDETFCSPCFSWHLNKPHAKPSVRTVMEKLKRSA